MIFSKRYAKYNNILGDIDYNKVDVIRKFRNKVVHESNSITSNGLLEYDALLEYLLSYIHQYSEDKISMG